MKVVIRIVLSAILAIGIVGCVSADSKKTSKKQAPSRILNPNGEEFAPASPKLLTMLAAAQAAVGQPIYFVWIPAKQKGSQGEGDIRPDGSREIKVRQGYEQPHTEAVIAHELGHLLVEKAGYGRYGLRPPTDKIPSDTRDMALTVAKGVYNCYLDPLVDAESRKVGIDPQPNFDEKNRNLKQDADEFLAQGELESIGARNYEIFLATSVFCNSLRMDVTEQYKIFAGVPNVVSMARFLQQRLGNAIPRTPAEYLALTVKLRDQATIPDVAGICDSQERDPSRRCR